MSIKSWFEKEPKRESAFDAMMAENAAKAAQEAARAKAEWEALPDHRKAARLEYRALQGLRYGRVVPELEQKDLYWYDGNSPPIKLDDDLHRALQQFKQNATSAQMTSHYSQMNNEIGRALCLEQNGFP
jgi:hypothetical protein